MSEPVTQGQFFEAMRQLDEKLQDYHRRGREHVDQQADKILEAFAEHELSDRAVADRVLRIETERGIEKQTAARRGALAGSIVAAGVVACFEGIKKALGH